MIISEAIDFATEILRKSKIENPRHEAQILLIYVANFHKTSDTNLENSLDNNLFYTLEYILAHPEKELNSYIAKEFTKIINQRSKRKPLAYIVKEKEFYGRNFTVTPDVLIPRPETETLVDIAINLAKNKNCQRILEIGTGSGAIAVTLSAELPSTQIFASDISDKALKIAMINSAKYEKIKFIKSDLLDNISGKFDLIIANLPYVDRNWQAEKNSPEILYEPEIALFADDDGTKLIKKLIKQAPKNIAEKGFLILEMDPEQMNQVSDFANKNGFHETFRQHYALVLEKQ